MVVRETMEHPRIGPLPQRIRAEVQSYPKSTDSSMGLDVCDSIEATGVEEKTNVPLAKSLSNEFLRHWFDMI